MAVTVVDLVSDTSDEENDEAVVDRKISATSKPAKRKIEEPKKEPYRKNPWFRNSNTARGGDSESEITLAQRVSPGLEEQKLDEDEEDVIFVEEKPPKFVSTKASAKEVKKVSVKAATGASFPSSQTIAATTPPQIWWDSDNAIITHGVLPSLLALKGGNLLLSNTSSVVHIQQMDRWSCGFRNIQMILSGLVPLLSATHPYFQSLMHIYCQEVPDHLLGASSPVLILPSLTQLQQQLEACWREGFDPNGADHFKNSVVGRKSRIGAVEVGFVFAYWWLDACVVQFIKCFQSRRLLPPFVYHYFRGCSESRPATKKALDCLDWADKGTSSKGTGGALKHTTVLPLYLQWEGHSVTIVGIEPPSGATDIGKTSWSQWNLLIFCPSRNCSRLTSSNTTVAPFRLSCRQLLQKDCQVILSSSEPLTLHQRMERKEPSFVVTAAKGAVMEYAQRAV